MDSVRIRQTIRDNAAEIVRLQTRVNESDGSEHGQACAEFHGRIDALAFPGGFKGA